MYISAGLFSLIIEMMQELFSAYDVSDFNTKLDFKAILFAFTDRLNCDLRIITMSFTYFKPR